METTQSHLRYVAADRLDTSAGRLDDVVVVNAGKEPLGKLRGVVVDPAHLQVRFYVVACRGWFSTRHYLMPLRAARLTGDAHMLEVDVEADELKTFGEVNPSKLPAFSEDDLLTAMFHSHAA
jgi:hypothetical protein